MMTGRKMSWCICWYVLWEGCGFRMERSLSVDAKGKRQESSGGGRVSGSLWKRVMLSISLRQRNDGQLSCLNRSIFGVQKGARKDGAGNGCLDTFNGHGISLKKIAKQETHYPVIDVESISTVVPVLLDVVLLTATRSRPCRWSCF